MIGLAVPPAGIYQLAGTMRGQSCWIAYDDRGECHIASGVGACHELEAWLRDRGVHVAAPGPRLQLVT